jgi:cytochrome b involved in lipid metabolism
MKFLFPIILIVVLASGYFFYQKSNVKNQVVPETKQAEVTNMKKYSLSEVEKHSSKEDCWLAIEGRVYDATSYISSGFHPGKAAILEGCGKNATSLFNTRPMGSKTPHSEIARKMMAKFQIGDLSE